MPPLEVDCHVRFRKWAPSRTKLPAEQPRDDRFELDLKERVISRILLDGEAHPGFVQWKVPALHNITATNDDMFEAMFKHYAHAQGQGRTRSITFAFGPSGTGKSHTLALDPNDPRGPGVLYAVLRHHFGYNREVHVQMVQVVDGKITDLVKTLAMNVAAKEVPGRSTGSQQRPFHRSVSALQTPSTPIRGSVSAPQIPSTPIRGGTSRSAGDPNLPQPGSVTRSRSITTRTLSSPRVVRNHSSVGITSGMREAKRVLEGLDIHALGGGQADYDAAIKDMQALLALRETGKSELNDTSSRSHLIIAMTSGDYTDIFIDMCGSEPRSNDTWIQRDVQQVKQVCLGTIGQKGVFANMVHYLVNIDSDNTVRNFLCTALINPEKIGETIKALDMIREFPNVHPSKTPKKPTIPGRQRMPSFSDDLFARPDGSIGEWEAMRARIAVSDPDVDCLAAWSTEDGFGNDPTIQQLDYEWRPTETLADIDQLARDMGLEREILDVPHDQAAFPLPLTAAEEEMAQHILAYMDYMELEQLAAQAQASSPAIPPGCDPEVAENLRWRYVARLVLMEAGWQGDREVGVGESAGDSVDAPKEDTAEGVDEGTEVH